MGGPQGLMPKARSPSRRQKKGASSKHFYYAEGKRVPLEEDRSIRVLSESAFDELVTSEEERRLVRERARSLPGGLLVVDLRDVSEKTAAALRSDERFPAIFRHGQEMIHVLPEIAVASSDPSSLAAARKLLEGYDAEIQERRAGEFVARLPTESGAEILDLATRVFEQTHTEMAAPRFVRIVPRPRPRS